MLLIRPTGQGITLLSDVMRDFKSAILTQTAWNQFAKRMERGTISLSVKVLCNLTMTVLPKWESYFSQLGILCLEERAFRFVFYSVTKHIGKYNLLT